MTLRIRTELAWCLRRVAKALNARAEKLEPVKISAPIANCEVVRFDSVLNHEINSWVRQSVERRAALFAEWQAKHGPRR